MQTVFFDFNCVNYVNSLVESLLYNHILESLYIYIILSFSSYCYISNFTFLLMF